MKIEISKKSNTRPYAVFIDDIDFGDFDNLNLGKFSYFPKKQDRLTGEHYIAIGRELIRINKHRI